MTAQVISIGQMTEEQAIKVAEAGVASFTPVSVAEIDLREPEYGEEVVGMATPEEASLYYHMWKDFQAAERAFREAVADALVRGGEALRESDLKTNMVDALRGDDTSGAVYFKTEAAAEEFSTVAQRHTMLKTLLWYKVGDRLEMHSWHLGFRRPKSGSNEIRIVRTTKRWGDAGS